MSTHKHTELTIGDKIKPISASVGKNKQARYIEINCTEVGSIFKSKRKPEFMDAYTFL